MTFNLSGSLNFSGSNDIANLSDHSYIGLLSGDSRDTVVGNNATIGTQHYERYRANAEAINMAHVLSRGGLTLAICCQA